MSYRPLFVVLVSTLIVGCTAANSKTEQAEAKAPQEPKVEPAVEKAAAPSTTLYGEALPQDLPALELAALFANPKENSGKTGLLSGHVRQACTKKGCWMELSTSTDPKAKSCRVKFKDYGFFVPLDSAGSTARLAATASIKVVSKEHVDHYEAEGASFSDKNPDGTANEIQLVATGVELTR